MLTVSLSQFVEQSEDHKEEHEGVTENITGGRGNQLINPRYSSFEC